MGATGLQIGVALQLDPPIERFDPKDPVGFIISENLVRRHLTVGQRAMIAGKLAELRIGRPKKTDICQLNCQEVTRAEVAGQLGITRHH
jgi:hypothetical protein